MANTPLTVTTAAEAGQVAAAIANVTQIIADLQAAIAGGGSIYQMSASLQGVGAPLTANVVINPTDTATIFNAILAVCQANLATLNATLAAF